MHFLTRVYLYNAQIQFKLVTKSDLMVLVMYTITDQLLLLSCSILFSVVLPAEGLSQCGSPEHRLVLPRWRVGLPSSASGATFHVEM